MTLTFIGTDIDGFTVAASGDMVVVVDDGRLSLGGFGDAFNFGALSSVNLVVQGSIFCEDGDGVSSDAGSINLDVTIDVGGAIIAGSDAIELNGTNQSVANAGYLRGVTDSGIQMLDTGGIVMNSGQVYGFRAIVFDASGGSISNSGLIEAENGGIQVVQDTKIVNSGTISAGTTGVVFGAGSCTLINTGTIISRSDLAVDGSEASDVIRTSGDISGNVNLDGGEDVLQMSGGEIVGNVDTGSGADIVDLAAGIVQGDVFLGDDGDLLHFGHGVVSGDVDTGLGADTLKLGEGLVRGDVLMGDQNDVFQAESGSVLGQIKLGNGSDKAFGGAADEVILGEGGSDVLRGRGGDDELYGGNSTDKLIGGFGDDLLTGGAGADVFVFGRKSGDDVITDFEDGVDRIDLSNLLITGDALTAIKAATQKFSADSVLVDLGLLGGAGSIEIDGLTKAQMTLDDFIL